MSASTDNGSAAMAAMEEKAVTRRVGVGCAFRQGLTP